MNLEPEKYDPHFDKAQQQYLDTVLIPKVMGRAGNEAREAYEVLKVKYDSLLAMKR